MSAQVFRTLWKVVFLASILIYAKQKKIRVLATHHNSSTSPKHNDETNTKKKIILKLAINSSPPYTFLNETKTGQVYLDKGPEVELLRTFQQKFNFEYEIMRPIDGEWGRLINHSWTGLIGLIVQKEADIAAGCISLTYHRYKSVLFSVPYDLQKSVIITRKPKYKSKVYAVLMPFSLGVWILILAALLITSTIFYFINKFYATIFSRKLWQFDAAFWYFLGSFASEGGNLSDIQGPAPVIIISTWLTFVLIVQSSYSGMLMRVLSFQAKEPAIDTLSDVAEAVEKRGFKCGCIKGTINQATIMDLEGPLSVIRESMLQDNSTIVESVTDGLTKVLYENYAFLAQEVASRYFARLMNEDDFYMSNEGLGFEAFGFVLKKGFPYTKSFNSVIQKTFEAGLVNKWRRDQTVKFETDSFYSSKGSVSAVPLTVTEMQGAFMLCVYGLALAIVVFFTEQIDWKLAKMKGRKKKILKRLR